jgi:diaminohydroxyphosphoribosylaminopyrimidine deaminase/5-amino-6-(5-phosphoribosylamino)uracil reductase
MTSQDEKYMRLAIKLAGRGIGSVEPNPAVGCVIVKNGKIIGSSWHKKFGQAHAEVNAIADCRKNHKSPAAATMYVTLEPCRHQGKTPACCDAIIAAGLKKVFVATADPSPHANGKGIRLLAKAGIEVETGLCKDQAKLLNSPFFKYAATGRCWVILKWAQSIEGKMAWSKNSTQRWISNEQSRKDSHKLRRRVQAILVGINTVIADDPLLTARPARGKILTRIVLDSKLTIPLNSKLLATAKASPVLIVTGKKSLRANKNKADAIIKKGAEVLPVPLKNKTCDITFLLEQLSKRGICQLLVEGGPAVITSFLRQNLADEIRIYITPRILAGRGGVNITEPMAKMTEIIELDNVEYRRFGTDIRLTARLI